MQSRLRTMYKETIAPELRELFKYENVMQTPKLEKVVVHVGISPQKEMNIEAIADNLKKITGQAPAQTIAKKSISNFKLREGMPVGLQVTLRGEAMYEFIDRLVSVTLPRVQDFRGLSKKGFDRQGNYHLGFKDQMPFPEIQAESIEQLHGLEITVKTTATKKEEGYELLKRFGFPFKEKKASSKA